ncbi:Tc toxin subunit A [Pseudomonas fragi]|uniref:Tc toxin subunit A n=1 Tax=Pseudomonas fragi TaxID=296 RepID=UPI003917F061
MTESPPTWSALFKDDWNSFCSSTSLAAVDSPAAYLQALYRFALEVEGTGQGTAAKITLARRRPMLKDLLVDAENTTRQLPLLALVNETLLEPVKAYLKKNRDIYGDSTVEQVLAELRYPFALPFDLAHRQCVLGLGNKKPGLGELNYRISLKLPCSQQPENKYGTVLQEAYVAQRLLTLLSPAQQNLLTEDIGAPQALHDPAAFYKKHYGHEQPITGQQQFMQHTGLNSLQLQELLASASCRPRLSANVVQTADQMSQDHTVGARFINGPHHKGQKNLALGNDTTAAVHLLNTSLERHDRLQRMIRLQRWLDIPYADLDTLLYSARACEGSAKEPILINDNSLRALGVFGYLRRRYGITPETFGAWLYQMPVHGVGHTPALFDRVFNPPHGSGSALTLDNRRLDLNTDAATLYQVCAALGLEDTPQSLGLLTARSHKHLKGLRRDLATFSSFYRQATLPALFGLTLQDADHLAQLLGGEDYRLQLVSPNLRPSGSNVPADFLDVLMQLDWAVTWFKGSGTDVQQIRRHLILDGTAPPSRVQLRLRQLEEVLHGMQQYLLPQATLAALDLPQPEAGARPLGYTWGVLLAKGLLRAQSQLPIETRPGSLEKGLAYMIDRYVNLSTDVERNLALKSAVKLKLNPLVADAYARLLQFRQVLEQLFKQTSTASETSELLRQGCRQAARIFANALGSETPQEILKHLLLYLPDAETDLQLPLERTALHAFLLNPHWLDHEQPASAPLKLALSTLYLFERFHHCSHAYGVQQPALLNYLQLANTSGQSEDLTAQTCQQLSVLLGWSISEIEVLANRLPEKRVRSMAELDWLIRCHDTARQTGLSASMLLMATRLTATFSSDDWTRVGNAILAALPSTSTQPVADRPGSDHV